MGSTGCWLLHPSAALSNCLGSESILCGNKVALDRFKSGVLAQAFATGTANASMAPMLHSLD